MQQPKVLLLTSVGSSLDDKEQNKLIDIFKANGYEISAITFDYFNNVPIDPVNLIIVDLDHDMGNDCETFKERLTEKATRIAFVCTYSFQRLLYYKDIGTCYTSYGNLVESEFFAY